VCVAKIAACTEQQHRLCVRQGTSASAAVEGRAAMPWGFTLANVLFKSIK
jgi:hypothetical protein